MTKLTNAAPSTPLRAPLPTAGPHLPSPPPRPDAIHAEQTSGDIAALGEALKRVVRGEVRFNDGDRALYSTDASNYRQIPIGVVVPRDADDVVAAIGVCRDHGAPVFARGGGTDLAGSTCNAAVVLDMSKYMNHVLEMNWDEKWARVEPGTVLDDLRDRAEEQHLTFGPDPATHNRNTLGGMIGNNSCGMHAQMAGKVEENTLELEILTYDGLRMWVGPTTEEQLEAIIAEGGRRGDIYATLKGIRDRYADRIRAKFPHIPRLISGYPLQQLLPENGFNVARALVGTENTCVTVLQAKLRLVHSPPFRTLAVFGFPDIFTAGDHVAFCNEHKPIALEGLDSSMFTYMTRKGMSTAGRSMMPDGDGWLIVEFGGESQDEANKLAQGLMDAFGATANPPSMKMLDRKEDEKRLWEIREAGLGATSKIPNEPDFYPGWEDSAVAPKDVGKYTRDLQKLFDKYGYTGSLYGHFGQGCIHCSIDFDLYTADGIAHWKRFLNEAAQLCTSYGGSLSGEHGDGQARGSLLPIMFGDEIMQAFREFKSIWDPQGRMNPGKVIDAYAVDENLRWGTHYHPWEPETHFSFKDDSGNFSYAVNRCVGSGKCRKHDTGTMCPSYMATREEKDSTRGRARLLFEMLEGNPLKNGWRNETVRESLDLCLSCKGCRGECPVNVDIATYKSEFLAHYFKGHLRPVAHYAFGLMYWWARAASHMPRVANFFTQTPVLRSVAKWLVTMAPERQVPAFATQTFKAWFNARTVTNVGKPQILFWADTWNNYFKPETAIAAVQVLEAAGFQVTVPNVSLCCGRPLYDYGMLEEAKKLLREILDTLRPQIQAGMCVVGIEPSCVSVFRDELLNLITDDEDAKRLSAQTFLLTEFLAQKAPEFAVPPLKRKALVSGHCHQRAVLRWDDEIAVLDKLGVDYTVQDSGCCGMAGAFGYEKGDHYNVSIKCGERVLLPQVRQADTETLIVTNGFSCREQILQTTDRKPLHIAQVLKMALDQEQHTA